MLRLSIIIPVYNVEKYLQRCVESVANQDIPQTDYEVILVNDGSTDSSAEICSALAGKYDNIKLVNKENGGSSSARNMGLDHAKGDYITFVDSDDYLLPDKLAAVLSVAENNKLDLCIFNFKVMSHDGSSVNTDNPLKKGKIYNCEEASIQGYQVGSACDKLYLRKMLESNNIRFRTDIIFGEDSYFSFQVLLKSGRIMNTDVCAYVYTANPLSVTKDTHRLREKEIRRCEDSLQFIKLVRDQSEDTKISSRFRKYLKTYATSLRLGFLISLISSKHLRRSDAHHLIRKAKSMQLYPYEVTSNSFPKALIMHVLNVENILHLVLRFRLKS